MTFLRRKFVIGLLVLAGCAPTDAVYERSPADAIQDGVDYRFRTQSPDGSWGQGRETTPFDVMASVIFLMVPRPTGSTPVRSSAASDVYKRPAAAGGLR